MNYRQNFTLEGETEGDIEGPDVGLVWKSEKNDRMQQDVRLTN